MSEADELPGFLSSIAATPWTWGECDCLLAPADWVKARIGRDPAETWRRRYRTELGAKRILKHAGGIAALVDAGMNSIGIARAEIAKVSRGDVGLVETTFGVVGAICIHPQLWAVKSTGRTLMAEAFPVAVAYRVVRDA